MELPPSLPAPVALALDEISITRMGFRRWRSGAGKVFGRPAGATAPTHEALVEEVARRPPRLAAPLGTRPTEELVLESCGLSTRVDYHPAEGADTLLVWHQGLTEIPHDFIPLRVRARSRTAARTSWLIVKAPAHETEADVWRVLMAERDRYFLIAFSMVAALGVLAEAARARYRRVVVAGFSWGGALALANAAYHGSFDRYVLLLSGPATGDLTFESVFGRLVDRGFAARERSRPGAGDLWDFTAPLARAGVGPKLRPLLARHDRYWRCPVQTAAYARVPGTTVDYLGNSHFGSAFAFGALAAHVDRALEEQP
jgi:hypothetical protein